MNLQQLQNLISYWVDDPNQTYFLPAQTMVFLNNAQQEVNKRLTLTNDSWYRKCGQLYTVQNQECYAPPPDFEKVNHMTVIPPGSSFPNENRFPIVHCTEAEADRVSYAPASR